jgi:hypothetical protein
MFYYFRVPRRIYFIGWGLGLAFVAGVMLLIPFFGGKLISWLLAPVFGFLSVLSFRAASKS